MLQSSFTNIANKLNVENDIEQYYNNEFKRIFPKIKKTIRERWKKGETPSGNKIGLYAWYSYSLFKEEMNPLAGFGIVDLTLTGNLGENITFGILSENEYQIFSIDEKYNHIIEKYGEWNFNITEQETEQIVQEITTKIVTELLKKAYYG